MKMEHVTFPEAVEQCAERIGYQIRYEGGAPGKREEPGTRQRLVAANKAAHEFYREQFHSDIEGADVAREFLLERGFQMEHADYFGCGFAPAGWDTLTKHLLRKGFNFKELEAAGLSRMVERPNRSISSQAIVAIKNVAGDVIGFGARKLFDDDKLGKYMNTPETLLYKKSKVLLALTTPSATLHLRTKQLWLRAIQMSWQCTLPELKRLWPLVVPPSELITYKCSGVSCWMTSSFVARSSTPSMVMKPGKSSDARVRGDQQFTGRSYVTIAPGGMGPCDIRMDKGDAAVRELVASHPDVRIRHTSIVGGLRYRQRRWSRSCSAAHRARTRRHSR